MLYGWTLTHPLLYCYIEHQRALTPGSRAHHPQCLWLRLVRCYSTPPGDVVVCHSTCSPFHTACSPTCCVATAALSAADASPRDVSNQPASLYHRQQQQYSMHVGNQVKGKKVKRSILQLVVKLVITSPLWGMPYGITQCYLPPGSGDFPALPQPWRSFMNMHVTPATLLRSAEFS